MPVMPVEPRERVRRARDVGSRDDGVAEPARQHAQSGGSPGRGRRSVVYSSDTRPCPEVEALSRGATALVHEATFARPNPAEWHSTAREAGAVARAAGVGRLYLAHVGYTVHGALRRPRGRRSRGLRGTGDDGGGAPLVSGLGLLGRLGRLGRLSGAAGAQREPGAPRPRRRQRGAAVDPRRPAGHRLPDRRGVHDPHARPPRGRRCRAGAHPHDDRRRYQLAVPPARPLGDRRVSPPLAGVRRS